jgi:hypothetical protein
MWSVVIYIRQRYWNMDDWHERLTRSPGLIDALKRIRRLRIIIARDEEDDEQHKTSSIRYGDWDELWLVYGLIACVIIELSVIDIDLSLCCGRNGEEVKGEASARILKEKLLEPWDKAEKRFVESSIGIMTGISPGSTGSEKALIF